MTILVTGAAGFIGFSVCRRLLADGQRVIGLDNLNTYYDPTLKTDRLAILQESANFSFLRVDLAQDDLMACIPAHERRSITNVLHFAAQAGVRHSMKVPAAFIDANIQGQLAILELTRHLPALRHLVYASSSSVYGRNAALPFRETDRVDRPGSFYAVTKRTGELMAECHHHLHGLPVTGLRFFTVYGPWGRPDMAYYKFARAIFAGEPVTLYEGADLARDFTHVDDVVEAVVQVMDHPPKDGARLLNIGNNAPEPVTRLVSILERQLGRRADIRLTPRPSADVEYTWASIDRIRDLTGWQPSTDLESGLATFSQWFLDRMQRAG
ncbi:NAD-dependent epimerase/dehydratase family protein [Acetobacter estunensis]|uniref:NAD-dependent epimerase/dehydratase family protein n=1 Tax=Acetobacter estunensis TaxID=104097 RepID=UPI001C2D0B3D|nr:NAD-dependent epimerase/dehydratase family protein [Acetobacter estunensis]